MHISLHFHGRPNTEKCSSSFKPSEQAESAKFKSRFLVLKIAAIPTLRQMRKICTDLILDRKKDRQLHTEDWASLWIYITFAKINVSMFPFLHEHTLILIAFKETTRLHYNCQNRFFFCRTSVSSTDHWHLQILLCLTHDDFIRQWARNPAGVKGLTGSQLANGVREIPLNPLLLFQVVHLWIKSEMQPIYF